MASIRALKKWTVPFISFQTSGRVKKNILKADFLGMHVVMKKRKTNKNEILTLLHYTLFQKNDGEDQANG